MFSNEIRHLWSRGTPATNGWLSMPCAFGAEIMADQGFDSITIDMQHGLIDQDSMVCMLQAMRASGTVPFVRVAALDPALIMKALDAGALGVSCPMINTREQAEALVSHVRYPPQGKRSFGPIRANLVYGTEYFQQANEEVICLAMIETREGFENLESIVTTPGLDGILVGPSDLALDMGGGRLAPGLDRTEGEMLDAFQRIARVSRDAGIKSAFICGTPAYVRRAVDWGYDMITVANDVRYLAATAKSTLTETLREMGR